jgi:hypothetical protein
MFSSVAMHGHIVASLLLKVYMNKPSNMYLSSTDSRSNNNLVT